MKKYRLLKDLPDVKAGAEVTPFNHTETRYYNCKVAENEYYSWTPSIVENNSDWFSPEPSNPTKEEIIRETIFPYDNRTITTGEVRTCMDKHEASILEQLIEKICEVQATTISVTGSVGTCNIKTSQEVESEIIQILRNFKSE